MPGDDAAWYYAKNGQRLGPFSLEQLKQLAGAGVLQAHDLVYGDGSGQWVNVTTVPNLRTTLPPVTAILAVPPAPPAQHVATAEPQASASPVAVTVPTPTEQQPSQPGNDPLLSLFATIGLIAGFVGALRGTLPSLWPWLLYGTLIGAVIGFGLTALVLVGLRMEGGQHRVSFKAVLLRVPAVYSALGFALGLVLGLVFGTGSAAHVSVGYGFLTVVVSYCGLMAAHGIGTRYGVKIPSRDAEPSPVVPAHNPPVQVASHSPAPQPSLAVKALEEAPELLYCPLCSKQTDSLRTFSIYYIFFLVFFIAWGSEPILACPQCVRRHLLKRSVYYLLPANIFWPILAFSYMLALLDTGGKGHSLDVVEHYQLYTAPRLPSRPATSALTPRLARLAITVLILAGIVVAVYLFTS